MHIEKLKEIGTSNICPVIVIVRDNKILIGLRNYTEDKWQKISVWTLPGGRCNNDETIEMALRREVAEEIGIADLNINDFLGTVNGAKKDDIVYIFKGITNQEPKLLEPEKFSEWKWEYVDNFPENFINLEALKLIKKIF